MVIKKIKNILFTFFIISSSLVGCKQDDETMIMNHIFKSKDKYKSIESFSLEVNTNQSQLYGVANTSNNHNRIVYEYDYDNKIAHYIDESNSFDYYQMIDDFDYYEFYSNKKYKMVDKESYAYEEWSIVLAQNNAFVDVLEENSDFILNIVKRAMMNDINEFDEYKIDYTFENGILKGTLEEKENDATVTYNFEYNKYLLKKLSISSKNETYMNNVEYLFDDSCSIKKINKDDYVLMNNNEFSVNEIFYDNRIQNILNSRDSFILNVSQFDVKYNYKEISLNGEINNEINQHTKADLINGLFYRKNENKSSTTIYYVLEEAEGIGLYDVKARTYLKDKTDFSTAFYNIYIEYFYNYQCYVDALVLNGGYDYLYLTSDNNYDFDLFVEYKDRLDCYKFDNFIMTYYKSEIKVNDIKIITEINIDYSRSMEIPLDLKNYKEV